MNLQDVSHIHIPDGDVRMIHDSDNRLLWGAVGYNVLFSGNTFQQSYTGKNLLGLKKPSSNTFGFEPVVAEESGTITVNGTFTGGGGGFPWISDRQISIPAGTYTFSMKNPQSFNVSLRMFDAQGQYTSGKYIAAGATSGTFTLEYDCVRVAILIGAFSVGKTLNNQKFEELQLEAGSTATSFEPFVGGQPSPSPDYPQQIQTVTDQQTVTVQGKNLFDSSLTMVQGFVSNFGTIDTNTTSSIMSEEYIPVSADTDYTFSWTPQIAGSYVRNVAFYTESKTTISRIQNTDVVDHYSVTTPSGCAYIRFNFYNANGMTPNNPLSTYLTNFQLEKGNTVTSFEQYAKHDYHISLGSIELCKLGSYQDYIWKDGEDWKVHKATALATLTGSNEDWRKSVSIWNVSFYYASHNNTGRFKFSDIDTSALGNGPSSTVVPPILTNNFGVVYPANIFTDRQAVSIDNNSGGVVELRLGMGLDTTITTATLLTSWLATNNINVYYPLATPTDTTITDQTLIAQLEAIYNLVRRYGYNFVVSASGNNLPIIIDRTLL